MRIDYTNGHRASNAQAILALYGIAVTVVYGVKKGPDPAPLGVSRIELTDVDLGKTIEMLKRHDLMGATE